jgi:hypothetical protein
MAGFAIHVRVLALALLVGNIRMAGFAGLVSGKLCRVRRNFTDGGGPIVTVLPKARWDHEVADHQEHDECEDKKPRKPEQMACILENTHRDLSTTAESSAADSIQVICNTQRSYSLLQV